MIRPERHCSPETQKTRISGLSLNRLSPVRGTGRRARSSGACSGVSKYSSTRSSPSTSTALPAPSAFVLETKSSPLRIGVRLPRLVAAPADDPAAGVLVRLDGEPSKFRLPLQLGYFVHPQKSLP